MPRQTTDETTTTHDTWCFNHEDLTFGCMSEPKTVAGITSWVKRLGDGRVVAVIEDEDVDAAGLTDLGERVAALRGLVGV